MGTVSGALRVSCQPPSVDCLTISVSLHTAIRKRSATMKYLPTASRLFTDTSLCQVKGTMQEYIQCNAERRH